MKNLDLLLEAVQNIENQLVENGIIEDESIASEVIGELKEKLYREIKKKDLLEFHSKLQDLMDEYHHAIYLNDGIFKGFQTMEIEILNELNK